MSGDVAAQAPQRGRPRSERARTAILGAAAELLLAHGHAPLNDRFVRDVVDTVLDGICPARP